MFYFRSFYLFHDYNLLILNFLTYELIADFWTFDNHRTIFIIFFRILVKSRREVRTKRIKAEEKKRKAEEKRRKAEEKKKRKA